MSQPTLSQVHVNAPLTNISVAFLQRADNFLAFNVFPRVPVQYQSNIFTVYPRDAFMRNDVQFRAPGAESAGSGYTIDLTNTYTCLRDALHKDIDDPTRRNAQPPIDLDREAAEYLAQQLLISAEARWVTKFFTTGIWTGSSTGSDITPTTKWDDGASTPIEDVRTQKRAILQNTGQRANVLVLGAKTFDNLLDHPDIIDRIKYGQTAGAPAMANEVILAQIFGVDRVYVARGVKNTATEGKTLSASFIADQKSAGLFVAAANPGLMTPSAGYTFVWAGEEGTDAGTGMRIKRFRLERNESDRVEAEMWYDHRVVSAPLGAFFTAAVS